ncbi:MAG: DUF4433 domain-containing protein [Lachnospiraceae bacterium]|nr:DUF4433 domain-containing protein [Lachnospiraceae bacterium]
MENNQMNNQSDDRPDNQPNNRPDDRPDTVPKKKKSIIFVNSPATPAQNVPGPAQSGSTPASSPATPAKKRSVIRVFLPGNGPGQTQNGPAPAHSGHIPAGGGAPSGTEQKNRYRSDGIKRIGIIRGVWQRSPEEDVTLKIRELKTGEEIRGYLSPGDISEYGIGRSEDPDMEEPGEFYYGEYRYVYFEKRTTEDGKKTKARNLAPVNPGRKEDFDELKTRLKQYYEDIPLYDIYRGLLERFAKSRRIEPVEVYTLIHAGIPNRKAAGRMEERILRYHLKDHSIDEAEAKQVLDLLFQTELPFDAAHLFEGNFPEYISWLLDHYPDKKDIYYTYITTPNAVPLNLKAALEKCGEEEIIRLIEEKLDKKEDDGRIRNLIGCLDSDLLLRHPEYGPFASLSQKTVLAGRIRKEEEEKQRKIEEEQRRLEEEQRKAAEKERKQRETANIKKIIDDRKIEYFTHFTNADNLENILRNGLLPAGKLEARSIAFYATDDARLDALRGDDNPIPVCMSVSFPNYQMFYRKREHDDACKDWKWCILLLDPRKVVERDCRYYDHNAATGRIIKGSGIADTAADFESMFAPEVDGRTSGTNGEQKTEKYIREIIFPGEKEEERKYTTSPQAEVQCFEEIPKDCILKCLFKDKSTLEEYKDILDRERICAEVCEWYFGYEPYLNLIRARNEAENPQA